MTSKSKIYDVLTANPKGHFKAISVRSGEGASVSLKVHRFAVVGKGDKIKLSGIRSNRISVLPREANEADIPVTPYFSVEDYIHLGKQKIDLRISEISSPTDLRGLEFLEQFHYKTNSTLGERVLDRNRSVTKSSVGGRRAILYASLQIGEQWIPAGYVDLQMPLMMCKPRHNLFSHPFKHGTRNIAWDHWDTVAIKKHLNTIVRIARIVVAPELRGLGLSRRIIRAAKSFSVERWHIGGMRPIFMEVSAEMLSYIDFVSSSGFRFIGRTEGNIKRVLKDMEQMSRSPSGEFGMMSLQRKYFRSLEDFCKTMNISFDKGLDYLRRKIETSEDSLTVGEWAALRSVIRHPIPYFLCPLDQSTEEYLSEAQRTYPPKNIPRNPKNRFSARPRKNVH